MDLRNSPPPTSATRRRIDAARSFCLNGPDKCAICDLFINHSRDDSVHYCIECGKQCCESCGDFDGMRAYTWSCYNCLPRVDEGVAESKEGEDVEERSVVWDSRWGDGGDGCARLAKSLDDFPIGKKFDVFDTCDRWSEALVINKGGDEWWKAGDENMVQFQYIFWGDKWTEWININSERIAEFGSKTYQPGANGGGTLQVGQRIEAKDCYGKWYESTVTEINKETGLVKVHYRGWKPDKFDEWLPFSSDRIRQYGPNKKVYHRKHNPSFYKI